MYNVNTHTMYLKVNIDTQSEASRSPGGWGRSCFHGSAGLWLDVNGNLNSMLNTKRFKRCPLSDACVTAPQHFQGESVFLARGGATRCPQTWDTGCGHPHGAGAATATVTKHHCVQPGMGLIINTRMVPRTKPLIKTVLRRGKEQLGPCCSSDAGHADWVLAGEAVVGT